MPSNGYFSIWYKMLEKHLWNSFLLYLVVEILQLVPKIAVSPWYSIKEVFWKTSQNSQINTRSSHPEVLCQKKRFYYKFSQIDSKTSIRSLFFNKVALGTWRNSVKQGAHKNFANFTGWSLFLIKLPNII